MDTIEIKKSKDRLNILEIAATDKENLASKLIDKKLGVNKASYGKKSKKTDSEAKVKPQLKNINNRKNQSTQSTSILQSDLTVDNPSENYWKKLAESCKKALDIALKENIDLHNKVNELEYENSRLKTMLDEAKSLVEVLTEMIEENDQPNESVDSLNLDKSCD